MPRYLLGIIFAVITAVLSVMCVVVKKKRKIVCLTVISAAFAVGSWLLENNLPNPEFYTTKGSSIQDNKGYFDVEFPVSVYYTFVPYGDPKEDGQKYVSPFELEDSASISYVSKFMGIMWGETQTRDIILASNGEVEIIDTDTPGRSIAKITAYLKNNNVFPGDLLNADDFEIKGTTVVGDTVTIEEFTYSPKTVVEGDNVVTVRYGDLTSEVKFFAHVPKITSITANYMGEDVTVGDKVSTEDIQVMATYDDGHVEKVDSFRIQPVTCGKEGENEIKVLYGQWSDSISVNAMAEKTTEGIEEIVETEGTSENKVLFNNIYLDYDNKSTINQVQLQDWASDMKDLQGNLYSGKNLYISISDLFNGIQDTGDSFIDASVVYIFNPQFDLSKGAYVSGKFVVSDQYLGCDAYTDIVIELDGEEVWSTSESISGTTILPVPFEFDVNAENVTMTMKFHCNARGAGLGIGIIFNKVLH